MNDKRGQSFEGNHYQIIDGSISIRGPSNELIVFSPTGTDILREYLKS